MDIYDYKKRLEKVEKGIRDSRISESSKKIIFDYEKQMFIREFSIARIERCTYIIGKISEKLDKDLAPIQCPRCGTSNGATGKFCYKCGAALDMITAINVDKERASLTMELMDLIRQEPALLELLKGHMEARNETEKIKK